MQGDVYKSHRLNETFLFTVRLVQESVRVTILQHFTSSALTFVPLAAQLSFRSTHTFTQGIQTQGICSRLPIIRLQ